MFARAFPILAASLMLPLVAAASGKLKAPAALNTHSSAGQSLMSKARALDNNNDNQYYNWIAKYSVKFDGCTAIPEFEKDEGLRTRMLAKFRLCPTGSCNSCPRSGEYVVEMREFVEAVRDAKLEAQEYNCEVQEEACEYTCQNEAYNYNYDGNNNGDNGDGNNNNGYDEETCIYNCMINNGMSYCQQDENEDMNYEEFMECRALENDNDNNNNNAYYYNNNNNNYQQYYQGAYCNGKGVFIDLFTDSTCTSRAPSGTYEKMFGYSLPTDPVVDYECISCKEEADQDENNQYGNDYYDQDEVSDFCEKLYEEAGHCERNMDSSVNMYPDESACEMIHSTLTKLNRAVTGRGASTAVAFAWLFGIACVLLVLYVSYLHKKMGRKLNLSESTGVAA